MSAPYRPVSCRGCGEGVGSGSVGGWCTACEPLTCTCATPRPDVIGECAGCHRLCLSHSWHAGRPDVDLMAGTLATAGSVLSPAAATGDVDRQPAGATP